MADLYHEHPLRILRYSAKNIWLLIFPLLRGFNVFHHNKEWFYNWIKGAWFDILVVGIIIVFGYIRWYFSIIDLTGAAVIHRTGIIFRVCTTIPLVSISSATAVRAFYLRPFRAVNVRCDTRAGFLKSADMKFLVTEKVCAEFMKKLPEINDDEHPEAIPKPTVLSVVLFAFFFSSGLSGVIYLAAFFFQGGNIAQDLITASISKMSEESEKISRRFLLKIPDAAILMGMIFIGTWLISFFMNVLTYSRFRIRCSGSSYYISYGAINRKEHHINAAHINYTDLRQNLIMKFFEAVAVNISCAGYGTENRSLPVLLPVRRAKNIGKDLETIGIFSGVRTDFRPKKTGLWHYVWMPVILSAAVFPVHFIIAWLFPFFADLTFFGAIMVIIPSAWLIIVKIAAFFTSGISIYDDKIMVKCCKWTGFHTVIADRKKLVKMELEQTIFQKIGGRCSISLWFEGEGQVKFRVKSLDISDSARISLLLDRRLKSQ